MDRPPRHDFWNTALQPSRTPVTGPNGRQSACPSRKPMISDCELAAAGGLDHHPAADAQLPHRPDDLDQQALHGLDAAEDLDLVDRLDVGGQRSH